MWLTTQVSQPTSPAKASEQPPSLPTHICEALTNNREFTVSEKKALLCAVVIASRSWTHEHTNMYGETIKDILDRWTEECM